MWFHAWLVAAVLILQPLVSAGGSLRGMRSLASPEQTANDAALNYLWILSLIVPGVWRLLVAVWYDQLWHGITDAHPLQARIWGHLHLVVSDVVATNVQSMNREIRDAYICERNSFLKDILACVWVEGANAPVYDVASRRIPANFLCCFASTRQRAETEEAVLSEGEMAALVEAICAALVDARVVGPERTVGLILYWLGWRSRAWDMNKMREANRRTVAGMIAKKLASFTEAKRGNITVRLPQALMTPTGQRLTDQGLCLSLAFGGVDEFRVAKTVNVQLGRPQAGHQASGEAGAPRFDPILVGETFSSRDVDQKHVWVYPCLTSLDRASFTVAFASKAGEPTLTVDVDVDVLACTPLWLSDAMSHYYSKPETFPIVSPITGEEMKLDVLQDLEMVEDLPGAAAVGRGGGGYAGSGTQGAVVGVGGAADCMPAPLVKTDSDDERRRFLTAPSGRTIDSTHNVFLAKDHSKRYDAVLVHGVAGIGKSTYIKSLAHKRGLLVQQSLGVGEDRIAAAAGAIVACGAADVVGAGAVVCRARSTLREDVSRSTDWLLAYDWVFYVQLSNVAQLHLAGVTTTQNAADKLAAIAHLLRVQYEGLFNDVPHLQQTGAAVEINAEREGLLKRLFKHLLLPSTHAKILILLDGYDEIPPSVRTSRRHPGAGRIQQLFTGSGWCQAADNNNSVDVILTTRPLTVQNFPTHVTLRLCGLNDARQAEFVSGRLPDHVGAAEVLMTEIRGSVLLRDLARIPIVLDIMCYNRKSDLCRVGGERRSTTTSVGTLYARTVQRILIQWTEGRHMDTPADAMELTWRAFADGMLANSVGPEISRSAVGMLCFFAQLAWEAIRKAEQGVGIFGGDLVQNVLERVLRPCTAQVLQEAFTAVMKTGLLLQVSLSGQASFTKDTEFTFAHLTFLEFFAAVHVSQAVAAGEGGPLPSPHRLLSGASSTRSDLRLSEAMSRVCSEEETDPESFDSTPSGAATALEDVSLEVGAGSVPASPGLPPSSFHVSLASRFWTFLVFELASRIAKINSDQASAQHNPVRERLMTYLESTLRTLVERVVEKAKDMSWKEIAQMAVECGSVELNWKSIFGEGTDMLTIATMLADAQADSMLSKLMEMDSYKVDVLHGVALSGNKELLQWLTPWLHDYANELVPYAAEGGSEEVFKAVVSDKRVDMRKVLDVEISEGNRVLHFACRAREGRIDTSPVVRVLLDGDSERVLVPNWLDKTPLHVASEWDAPAVVKTLLDSPEGMVALQCRDKDDKTPLDVAIDRGKDATVKVIVEKLAATRVDFAPCYLRDALQQLVLDNRHGLIDAVLSAAKQDMCERLWPMVDAAKRSLVMLAATSGCADAIDVLARHRFPLGEKRETDGLTALHLACEAGQGGCAELLLGLEPALATVED